MLNYSREEWEMDWMVNQVGIPVDLALTQSALNLWGKEKENIHQQLLDITQVDKATRGPVMAWLAGQGLFLENMQKEYLGKILMGMRQHGQEDTDVYQVLQLWTEYGGRSVDKFSAIQRCVESDGRIRNVFQFMGASRTGRWAGRYLQPHNLRSTMVEPDEEAGETWDACVESLVTAIHTQDPDYLKANYHHLGTVPQLLGSAVRHAVKAPSGRMFSVRDLSSIESVVLGWLTDCKAINNAVAKGLDTYKLFAEKYFNVAYEEVTKKQRKFSKPPVLGCGYQLGWRGLIVYADGMGVVLQEKDAKRAVKTWRDMHPEVQDSWKWFVETVCDITEGKAQSREGYRGKIYRDTNFLYIKLPSGRELSYFQPEVRYEEDPEWGTIRRNFCYKGTNQYTGKWGTVYSHGGKLCIMENTKVLTEGGWVPIQSVTSSMRVWDGKEWVSQGGAVCQGRKKVMKAFGVYMTPDHRVLTDKGWINASESERYSRAESRLPDGGKLCWERWEEIPVASEVYLREHDNDGGDRTVKAEKERDCRFVWMHAEENYRKEDHQTREVKTPFVCGLEKHDRPLSTTVACRLGELWRARDRGMRRMVDVFREIFRGHEPFVSEGAVIGPSGQFSRIYERELSMDKPSGAGQKPPRKHLRRDSCGQNASGGGGREVWPEQNNSALPSEAGKDSRGLGGSNVPVYDLINCGPRNRFVVADENGMPLIVHNCENVVQAIARDILAHGALLFHQNYQRWARIFLHVHDEIAVESYEAQAAPEMLDLLGWCMNQPPAWAPDILLKSAGYIAPRYRKE